MSIGVRCEECGKTYQVKDEIAGRRGKCPKGHPIQVPALASAAPATEPIEENAFAFANEGVSNPKTGRRRPAPEPESEPESAPIMSADAGDFAFPSSPSVIEVRNDDAPAPKTGRQRRPESKHAGKEGKPNLMPLVLGGILAVLGIGGGTTMVVMSRGEVGPLRDQAEAANKKAAAAEEQARKAESLKLLAEADVEKLKKSPPKDPALADALAKLKAAEKRAEAAEQRAKDAPVKEAGADAVMPAKAAPLDPKGPGGKDDPVMPGGKLDAKSNDKMADGPPKGGKSWTAPTSATVGNVTLKAGDRLWLYVAEDAVLKADAGKLTVKFRWQLRQGKELPKDATATLVFAEAKMATALNTPVKLAGTGGEAEAAFTIRGAMGKMAVYVVITDGKGDPSGKGVVPQSTILALQAEFPGQ